MAFIADAHVEISAWAHRGIEYDSAYAIKQFVDYCVCPSNDVAAAFSLGDALDRQVNRSYGPAIWKKVVERLRKAGVPLYFIQGNHDFAEPPWLLDSGSERLDKRSVMVCGRNIYGLDYRDSVTLKAELQEVPDATDILLCHQAWEEFMGDITVPQGTMRDIPIEGIMASGDLHETHVKNFVGSNAQEFTFISPGSICMQNIDEDEQKYFIVISDDMSITKVPLKSRVVLRSPYLNMPGELEEYLQQIDTVIEQAAVQAHEIELPEKLHMPLFQVRYHARLTDCVRRITKQVRGLAHLFWKESTPTEEERQVTVTVKSPQGAAATPLSMLSQALNKDEEPDAYALLELALSMPDKKGRETVIARFCAERLGETNGQGQEEEARAGRTSEAGQAESWP